MLALLVVLALTLAWFALPFIPALRELLRPSDLAPLPVRPRDEWDTRHFARGLRGYLDAQLATIGPWRSHGGALVGDFADGTPALLIRENGSPFALFGPALDDEERQGRRTRRLVVARGPLMVPARLEALAEVYARGPVIGGEGAVFRAVLGEADVRLGASSTVLRWVHAEGDLLVQARSTLFGRASSEQRIVLGSGCRFERMYAPAIHFGRPAASRGAGWQLERLTPWPGESAPAPSGGRRTLRGDVRIPPGSRVDGNLVVEGTLHVGAGSAVTGSLKGRGSVLLDPDVWVNGSVVAGEDVIIAAGCRVRGPVIAERECRILADTTIGSIRAPTTVSAATLEVASGVSVFGTVWVREHGEVQPDRAVTPAQGMEALSRAS